MSTLLRPDQILQTPLNYAKYVDLENELTQEELVQFIMQLRDKHIQDAKQKVSKNTFDSANMDSDSILLSVSLDLLVNSILIHCKYRRHQLLMRSMKSTRSTTRSLPLSRKRKNALPSSQRSTVKMKSS